MTAFFTFFLLGKTDGIILCDLCHTRPRFLAYQVVEILRHLHITKGQTEGRKSNLISQEYNIT